MNANGIAAGGVVPVVNILDYLSPEINRPDLYYQRAYPMQPAGSSSAQRSIQRFTSSGEERSPSITLYYTFGLIIVSAFIFLSLAAWSNVLLSWYDQMFVSPLIKPVTKSRLYFAITLTVIAVIVIIILVVLW